MDSVLRGLAIYGFLFVVFRLSGKRALAEATTFDFILLLIISEATQQGLLGEDYSLMNAFVTILTLLGVDILMSVVEQRLPGFGRVLEGTPLVLIDRGELLRGRMRKARVDEHDILEKARSSQGLERIDQIRYAVLERDGSISVIPQPG